MQEGREGTTYVYLYNSLFTLDQKNTYHYVD